MFTEKWIPESIAECLQDADYRTFPEYYEEWDIEGTLVYWNPNNLEGYFPPEMFNNQFHGDWNVPFIMRVLFVNNWHYILDLFAKSEGHETVEACCAMCTDRCFNLGDHRTYTVASENYDFAYKGFYVCKNSTKDNFHVLCTDCFTQLMVDRGTTFSKNPKCPCCRTVPDLWLAFTYDSAYDSQELPIRWMKEFYARLMRHIDWDDIVFLHRQVKTNMEQLETSRAIQAEQARHIQSLQQNIADAKKEKGELQEALDAQKKEVHVWREKTLAGLDLVYKKDQELLHFRILELQNGGMIPAILGKTPKRKRSNVRLSIKKKMKEKEDVKEDFIEDS